MTTFLKPLAPSIHCAPRPGWPPLLAASPLACLLFCVVTLQQSHPAYHFYPLPLAALLFLIWRDRCSLDAVALRLTPFTRLLCLAHLVLAAAAFALLSPFLAGMAVVLAAVVASRVLVKRDNPHADWWAYPAITLFLVPPPLGLDFRMQEVLAVNAAALGQTVLDQLGILHMVEGVVFVTAEKRFFVNDACSGANSLLVALCVGLILSVMHRRPWYHMLGLLGAAGLIALGVNVARIVLIIYGSLVWDFEMGDGWTHSAFGMASFLLTLLLMASADRGLSLLIITRNPPTVPIVSAAAAITTPVPRQWVGPLRWQVASAVVALLGLASVAVPAALAIFKQGVQPHGHLVKVASEFQIPAYLAGWKRVGDQPLTDSLVGEVGVRNQVWRYEKDGVMAYVALNFPFRGIHDTRVCYQRSGWTLSEQGTWEVFPQQERTARFVAMRHASRHLDALLGLLVMDPSGQLVPFSIENLRQSLLYRLLRRGSSEKAPSATLVVQILIPASENPPPPPEQVLPLMRVLADHLGKSLSIPVPQNQP